MNSNISLLNIRSFVAIAELGSFTRAAEALDSSRAHLSRQLNQLEQQLGSQLLVRTTRSQRLTDAGRRLFEDCQHALQNIDQAVSACISENQQLQGSIRINCVGGMIGEELVSGLLSDFSQTYPDINIELDFSSQRVDLIGEGYDLVLRMGELEDSGLIARKLCDIAIDVMASPAYLQQQPRLERPQDLIQHNCLTGSVKRWGFEKPSKPGARANIQEVQVGGNYRCKSGRALIQRALQGKGIVRLPRLYCAAELKAGQLVSVFEDWRTPAVPFYLLYHQNDHQPERLKKLIAALTDGLAQRLTHD